MLWFVFETCFSELRPSFFLDEKRFLSILKTFCSSCSSHSLEWESPIWEQTFSTIFSLRGLIRWRPGSMINLRQFFLVENHTNDTASVLNYSGSTNISRLPRMAVQEADLMESLNSFFLMFEDTRLLGLFILLKGNVSRNSGHPNQSHEFPYRPKTTFKSKRDHNDIICLLDCTIGSPFMERSA